MFQVFGGRGITKTGMGEKIEHVSQVVTLHTYTVLLFPKRSLMMLRRLFQYHRTVVFDSILGGGMFCAYHNLVCQCAYSTKFVAEDVLGDLGVRQAMRNIPKSARL